MLGAPYPASITAFAVVIAIPAGEFGFGRFNAVFAFWFAYLAERPLGAPFADWTGMSPARGGLKWGTGLVSVALAILIVAGVAIIAATERGRLRILTNSEVSAHPLEPFEPLHH